MIKLNKNYTIKTDSSHGFALLHESDEYEKEVIIKGVPVLKMMTSKETFYYPKLSMCLNKFFKNSLTNVDSVELFKTLNKIESTIDKFDNTFASKGQLLEA